MTAADLPCMQFMAVGQTHILPVITAPVCIITVTICDAVLPYGGDGCVVPWWDFLISLGAEQKPQQTLFLSTHIVHKSTGMPWATVQPCNQS